MKHDARSVANELITRAIDADRPITPLQTLKLIYFSHAWMLAIHDRPLIKQRIYAWRHGPVVRDVYDALKRYGWRPIPERILGFSDDEFDDDELSIIDQVSEKYGKYSGTYLSAMTHARGTPWHQVWDPDKRNISISNNRIKDYYREQLES